MKMLYTYIYICLCFLLSSFAPRCDLFQKRAVCATTQDIAKVASARRSNKLGTNWVRHVVGSAHRDTPQHKMRDSACSRCPRRSTLRLSLVVEGVVPWRRVQLKLARQHVLPPRSLYPIAWHPSASMAGQPLPSVASQCHERPTSLEREEEREEEETVHQAGYLVVILAQDGRDEEGEEPR